MKNLLFNIIDEENWLKKNSFSYPIIGKYLNGEGIR